MNVQLAAAIEILGPDDRRRRLFQRIADACIFHVSESQRIISPSGKPQNWLIDLRRLFANAEALEDIAAAFFERVAAREAFQLAGMESASLPLLTALALV